MEKITKLINGIRTTYRIAGNKSHTPVIFLHGGEIGQKGYISGSHIWGNNLQSLSSDFYLLCPDLPGFSHTALNGINDVEHICEHIAAVIKEEGLEKIHIVGHDLGALLAFYLSEKYPNLIQSLTLVSSPQLAPTGDGLDSLTLMNQPLPFDSRQSQYWVMDRLSYCHVHVKQWVDEVENVMEDPTYVEISNRVSSDEQYIQNLMISANHAKSSFFKKCREDGVNVPVHIIWGENDPLIAVENGLWLFNIIADKQKVTNFSLVNRAGHFVFRDQAEKFNSLVKGFIQGITQEFR